MVAAPCGGLCVLVLACSVAAVEHAGEHAGEEACLASSRAKPCTGPKSSQHLEFLVGDYRRTQRPLCGSGSHNGPTLVEAQLFLTQVNEVDTKLGQVSLNGYFRTWWRDPRLRWTEGGCRDEIRIVGDDSSWMWQPDLFIKNGVEHFRGEKLVAVSYDGSVWSSQEIRVKVKTPIDLGKLPYDEHTCLVEVGSYAHGIEHIRVLARGGRVGPGRSGVGIIGAPMFSSVWTFESEDGFETAGTVVTETSWDYLRLEFGFTRRPKYYMDQVFTPTLLFLLVSYIQFFVDPKVAPARAALALISVLIMRTLNNSVYSTLPQGSQRMWLNDFLIVATFISITAACEFGIVQFAVLGERARAAELEGLLKSKPIAERLNKIRKDEGITMLELLERCRPVKVEAWSSGPSLSKVRQVAPSPGGDGPEVDATVDAAPVPSGVQLSSFARSHCIKEADLAFIKQAEAVFRKVDKDGCNQVSPAQVRRAMASFNIYTTSAQTASLMCMCLRDEGETTPLDEMEVRMTFCQFQFFLMHVESYPLGSSERWRSYSDCFWRLPPSKRIDAAARVVFAVGVCLVVLGFYVALPWY